MTLFHASITATTTPTVLFTASNGGQSRVYVCNLSATIPVYIGDSTITSSTGFQINTLGATGVANRQEFTINGNETLYVVTASSTANVTVIASGA